LFAAPHPQPSPHTLRGCDPMSATSVFSSFSRGLPTSQGSLLLALHSDQRTFLPFVLPIIPNVPLERSGRCIIGRMAEKNPMAVELGRRGGQARAARMDAGKRSEAARTAGIASGEVRSVEARFLRVGVGARGELPEPAMLDYYRLTPWKKVKPVKGEAQDY